ncbi:metal ABC transporter solute-binding protein, Zn/Mn family [Oceanobacillus salinisoli]|uniref:metal ABC transporter solute-binding protein, Zn/Mn family n=1 Tax=Oceanobacillus salinisoli TaxID=2678611 RepID=UPI0012E2ADD3|nr:zinc ABC transporter substrate-binding protein [Oceanobacillus salinisoli]
MRYLKAIILLILVTSVMIGCTAENTEEETINNNESLKIYTTVYPIEYAIGRISGGSIMVESVYPPGVDEHSYEPTSKDMTDIAKSDAFIYIGAGLEPFAETAAETLSSQNLTVIELGQYEELFHADDSVKPEQESDEHNENEEADHEDEHESHEHDEETSHDDEDEHDDHNHGDQDPHIWIDPLRMLEMSEIIKEELVKLNPESESLYNENFEELKEDLVALDEEFTETLQEKSNKRLLVAHAAYGYWEERYGIEQIAINGLSSSSEPSQKELTEIIDQARKYELDYVIFEQNTSSRLTEVIQDEIGAESATIHNLSVLTDEDIANNEDYLSLMKKNLETLNLVME